MTLAPWGVFAHQLIPQADILGTVHFDQLESADFAGLVGHVPRRWHRRVKTPCSSALPGSRRVTIKRHRQDKMPAPLKFAQRLGAARDLCRTATVEKAKVSANCIGQCAAMRMCTATEKLSDRFDRIGSLECSLDLVLLLHQPR